MREQKLKCIIPYDNRQECGIIEDMEIIPANNLKEVVDYLNNELTINTYKSDTLYYNEENLILT